MTFNIDGLLKKEAFAALGTERLNLFRKFAKDIEGKSTPEIVGLYMALNKQINVSDVERAAIIEEIHDSLPEKDRQKFKQILKILK